ncbi:MAG TPA: MerR family transcriptional regulator [Opitutus sp.]|nr:MerR family transcriptional regulator [Opitutus sp.]
MLTISQLGRKFGLSRSTLLYYDRLKLVHPTYRTSAGYRLYSDADEARLKQVCHYRRTGLPLADIAALLDDDSLPQRVTSALNRRLAALNREIAALRRQQQVVLGLLPGRRARAGRRARSITKEQWVALLRAAGMDDAEMRAWHVAFERQSPLAHQDFLESLGIGAAEIRRIRTYSRRTSMASTRRPSS